MATPSSTPDTHGHMAAWAPYYDLVVKVMYLGREKSLREYSLDLASIKAGDKVLEVGCGTGTLTLAAHKRVGATGETHGIDATEEMIAVARKKNARARGSTTFRVGLLEQIPYPDSTFDKVLCSFMLFHASANAREQGVKEIFRVLKPGGRFLVIEGGGKPDFAALRISMGSAGFVDMDEGRKKFALVHWPMLYLRGTAKKD